MAKGTNKDKPSKPGPNYSRLVTKQDERESRVYTVAVWMGIAIGGLICIAGVVLAVMGLSGSIEWVVKAADFESKLKNAGPGVVIALLGTLILWKYKPAAGLCHIASHAVAIFDPCRGAWKV